MPSFKAPLVFALFSVLAVGGVEAQQQQNATAPAAGGSSASVVGNATSTRSSSKSSSTAAANSGDNPLIPTTVSPACQKFLTYLNGDKAISACTLPLISTLALFAPSEDSTYAVTPEDVSTALVDLCGTEACSDTLIRSTLSQFNGNCSAELAAGDAAVLGSYDALYVLQPFREAVCSLDSQGGFCLTDIAAGNVPAASAGNVSTSSTIDNSTAATTNATIEEIQLNSTSHIASLATSVYEIDFVAPVDLFTKFTVQAKRFLFRRQVVATGSSSSSSSSSSSKLASTTSSAPSSSITTISSAEPSFELTSILPNAAIWSAHSLPFLFLSPNMSSSLLCTTCTKTILASYVSWESRIPYALGLANSPMLGQQGSLWTGVGTKCGSGFLSSIATQAGQQSSLASGASKIAVKGAVGLLAVAAIAFCM